MKRLVAMCFGIVSALCGMTPLPGFSQAFPTRPIRVVVPFPPGGTDAVVRIIGNEMSSGLGQPVVIENRAGANGMIGSEYVARAAPDGYTLLFGTISTHVTPIFLSKNLPYDPVKDFTPITMAVDAMFFVTVRAEAGVNTLRELIDLAKRNPGKLTYSSFGIGSINQVLGEQFKQLAGVDILHIPYKGGAPAQQALAAGEVTLSFDGSSTQSLVQSGLLKHLAVLDNKRFPIFPDVPPINDTLPDYTRIGVWSGFFGPPGLPQPILARLNTEIVKALNAPEVQSRLTSMGVRIIGDTPEEFREKITRDIALVGKVIKAAGIRPE
jgi:tripartite-type tricarboxylate transporter receptor subunit TctC